MKPTPLFIGCVLVLIMWLSFVVSTIFMALGAVTLPVINPHFEAIAKNGTNLCGIGEEQIYCPDGYICYVAKGFSTPFYCYHSTINPHVDATTQSHLVQHLLTFGLPLLIATTALIALYFITRGLHQSIEAGRGEAAREYRALKADLAKVAEVCGKLKVSTPRPQNLPPLPPSSTSSLLPPAPQPSTSINPGYSGTLPYHHDPYTTATFTRSRQPSMRHSRRGSFYENENDYEFSSDERPDRRDLYRRSNRRRSYRPKAIKDKLERENAKERLALQGLDFIQTAEQLKTALNTFNATAGKKSRDGQEMEMEEIDLGDRAQENVASHSRSQL